MSEDYDCVVTPYEKNLEGKAYPPAKDVEGSFRYPLAREGVLAPGGLVFLTHTMGRHINIAGLWPYGQHGEHC